MNEVAARDEVLLHRFRDEVGTVGSLRSPTAIRIRPRRGRKLAAEGEWNRPERRLTEGKLQFVLLWLLW